LSPFILALVIGCNAADQPDESRRPHESSDAAPNGNLRVIIRWYGDDFASKNDLALRDKLTAEIRQRHVGRVLRAGTGMGWMDIAVTVADVPLARREIESIMAQIAPDVRYTIE
jgi:hypothetical protein